MTDRPLSEEKRVYRVWYDNPSKTRCYVDVPYERGIASLEGGIWINNEGEYDLVNGVHWLPPSRFVLVSKLTVPLDEAPAGAQL